MELLTPAIKAHLGNSSWIRRMFEAGIELKKKYGAENVTLLYPRTDKVTVDSNIEFASQDGVKVRVRFVDLFDIQNSIDLIKKRIYSSDGTIKNSDSKNRVAAEFSAFVRDWETSQQA